MQMQNVHFHQVNTPVNEPSKWTKNHNKKSRQSNFRTLIVISEAIRAQKLPIADFFFSRCQCDLTQACPIPESRVTKLELENDNLMSESKNLTAQKEQLSMQMLALESEMRTLTQQMENLQARVNDFNKFNISRAQRTLDHYCPRKEDGSNRTCNACENGWLYFESRCYLINNADIPYLKTWEEARRECSESNSQLVVVENASEMSYIRDNSWGSQGNFGYWLGLKAEGGRWKWLDGSELTPEQSWQKSWIPQSQVRNGLCAISVTNEKLKAVECSERQRWICKKMPLSL
ncbi:asialoglycoprotein receptor 1 isoform X2 [Phyllopteryx taeniolatus]|uniref:asialoglycoprotein receptor 1 isoform X2 n=1 Tax=Phyllopteryx taeniolatus TaxID=161469 RepID=UPI002AD4B354|nr:asialoglycoprotein receptor 1 isoform X2 [Phyllopteryx taeniolatus]XP_061631802.1 asialoglycoprotein receptor 1 isoform X2 [Phyllopteryx taeniolatus]XP_061631805.1 asialoglycoprotein receptor 1 isoform X2 [Phyllopteryx taeniolatus]